MLGADEAAWVAIRSRDLQESGLLAWGPGLMALFCVLPGALLGHVGARLGIAPAPVAMTAVFFAAGSTVFFDRMSIDFADVIVREDLGPLELGGASLVAGLVLAGFGWWFAAHLYHARLVAVSLTLSLASVGFAWLASETRPPRVWEGIRVVETENLSRRNAQQASSHPDIVFIVADGLRKDHLSSYDEASPAQTPGLDALARDGIRFPRACAQSSWTKPTYASLVSGLDPHTHGATDEHAKLPSEVVTLAEALRAAGYYTVGTSNANEDNASRANFDQGFVEWHEFQPARAWWGVPRSVTRLFIYRRAIEPSMRSLVGHRAHHFYLPAEELTAWTLRWLHAWKRPRNVPLFLSLHYMDPHPPHFAGREEGPAMHPGHSEAEDSLPALEAMRAAYAGDVEKLDRGLADLFEGLRELGLYDDAIVLFTSDHGQELLDHGSWGHGESLYAEQLDIPSIVKLPGQSRAGSAPGVVARQIDVAPTLLQLAGVPVPEAMQGAALLTAEGSANTMGDRGCFASLERDGVRIDALHREDVSLIETRALGTQPNQEFFDLARDPAQRQDLAGRGDPRQAELAVALHEHLERPKRTGAEGEGHENDPGLEARLRALGYIE